MRSAGPVGVPVRSPLVRPLLVRAARSLWPRPRYTNPSSREYVVSAAMFAEVTYGFSA